VVIDNAGSTTVSGADATALYIEGDNALVINEGNQTISGGAVGDQQIARQGQAAVVAVDNHGGRARAIHRDITGIGGMGVVA
ncbi:hypothetical protein O6115_14535, partial [Salmonella enterica subsp. enterica]|uniref:hypothetical protein n=1 Tax=Salmonella enterica TaxID=28901 RepID=UPI0015C51E7B